METSFMEDFIVVPIGEITTGLEHETGKFGMVIGQIIMFSFILYVLNLGHML